MHWEFYHSKCTGWRRTYILKTSMTLSWKSFRCLNLFVRTEPSFYTLRDFDFSDEKLQDTTGVLPPPSKKMQVKNIPKSWEVPNRCYRRRFNRVSKILWRILYL